MITEFLVRSRTSYCILLLMLSSCNVNGYGASYGTDIQSNNEPLPSLEPKLSAKADLKSWNYLINLLIQEGLDQNEVLEIFSSPRMPEHKIVNFSVRPKESSRIYAKINNKEAREHALEFFLDNRRYFREAEKRFLVSSSVILAILQIESRCGEFTGKESVFYRLARLVEASNPDYFLDNLEYNRKLLNNKAGERSVQIQEVRQRAAWLRKTFLPHLVSLVSIAKARNVHPLDIKGSSAGGMGLPQFLPDNVRLFGVDANNDQIVNLDEPGDAILSVAKFLHDNGWSGFSMSREAKRNAILTYNKSTPYVDTVLNMAEQLRISISNLSKSGK